MTTQTSLPDDVINWLYNVSCQVEVDVFDGNLFTQRRAKETQLLLETQRGNRCGDHTYDVFIDWQMWVYISNGKIGPFKSLCLRISGLHPNA